MTAMPTRHHISPNDPALRTMGRIDDADPERPVWVFPYTQVSFRFTGTSLTASLINYWNYGDSHLGVVIDGQPAKVRIPSGFTGANELPNNSTSASSVPGSDEGADSRSEASGENGTANPERQPHTPAPAPASSSPAGESGTGFDRTIEPNDALRNPYGPVTVTLAERLPDIEHEVTVFKRQDGQHYVELLGFGIDAGAKVMPPLAPAPNRRIEVYGDSVSCGERNEASLYTGEPDPDVDLSSYSNAWHSYAAITARNLGAQLHDVSQGGISLIDGIGWFNGPDYVGQESAWDRIEYNPTLGGGKPWDFARYTPQVVIVAVGQNDAHPFDFMAADYDGDQAAHWRARYVDFLRKLRETYPKATIICLTTLLQHDPSWDRAIDEAVRTAADPAIHHFLFSRNGSATPGHPRVAEHEEMARELTAFIGSLSGDIWAE